MNMAMVILLSTLLAGVVSKSYANDATNVPQTYLAAVRHQHENRFGENDIRSFVYHVFGLYDKHVEVSKFLPLLADKGLDMRFPDATLRSRQDFKRWYAGIGENIRSNTHQLERLDVSFLGNGRYQVDLIVLWQALTSDNKFLSMRVHQVWTLDGGKNREWPRILSYVAQEVPGAVEAPK